MNKSFDMFYWYQEYHCVKFIASKAWQKTFLNYNYVRIKLEILQCKTNICECNILYSMVQDN